MIENKSSEANRVEGFPPLVGKKPKVLILGTFPGRCSLCCGEYYADTSNAFRKIIMEICTGKGADVTYDNFVKCLDSKHIALWDVHKSCIRKGSSDKNITNPKPNKMEEFLKDHPTIKKIIFNGKKAEKEFRHSFSELKDKKELCCAPSTSSQNRWYSYEEKKLRWQEMLG